MKRSIICIGVTAVLFVLTAVSSRAATFNVCNNTNEQVNVAIGYDDKDLGMVSEGWWKLAVGECADIKPADGKDHQYYFLYGRGERGGNWSSFDSSEEAAFCVRKRNFNLINRDFEKSGKLECERRSADAIKFRRIDTFVGGKPVPKFTYALTKT